MTTNATEECLLEPENLSENKFVYIFRSAMVLMSIVSLILSVFLLDTLKEKTKRFRMLSLLGATYTLYNSINYSETTHCYPIS